MRCLVMDDTKMFCEAFVALLEKIPYIQKAEGICSVKESAAFLKKNAIDLIFADARMRSENGMEFIRQTKSSYPNMRIIGITSYDGDDTLFELIRAGVNSILLKENTSLTEIDVCIKAIGKNGHYWPPRFQPLLAKAAEMERLLFTELDRELIKLLSKGLVAKQIASFLGKKPSTIEDQRKRLFQKTGTKNVAELIAFFFRHITEKWLVDVEDLF
jgi:DNA-binding NarL/FixJ family response regulator